MLLGLRARGKGTFGPQVGEVTSVGTVARLAPRGDGGVSLHLPVGEPPPVERDPQTRVGALLGGDLRYLGEGLISGRPRSWES